MPTSWFSSENFLRGLWPKFILSACLSSPSYLSVCSSLFVFVCFSCRVRLLSVFAFYFFSILPKIFFLLLSLSWWSFGIVSSFHFWFQLTTLQAIFYFFTTPRPSVCSRAATWLFIVLTLALFLSTSPHRLLFLPLPHLHLAFTSRAASLHPPLFHSGSSFLWVDLHCCAMGKTELHSLFKGFLDCICLCLSVSICILWTCFCVSF